MRSNLLDRWERVRKIGMRDVIYERTLFVSYASVYPLIEALEFFLVNLLLLFSDLSGGGTLA